MKDDLVGRLVGYAVPHTPACEVPDSEVRDITQWGRVLAVGPFTAIVEPHHGEFASHALIRRSAIHTTLPKAY